MPNVTENMGSNAKIVLHKCPKEEWFQKWTKLINRQGFVVSKHTRICSNHFVYGQPREQEPHPVLFMKGYQQHTPGRKPPARRKILTNDTDQPIIDQCEAISPVINKTADEYENDIQLLKEENSALRAQILNLEKKVGRLTFERSFGIHSIKHSDYQIKVYTGN